MLRATMSTKRRDERDESSLDRGEQPALSVAPAHSVIVSKSALVERISAAPFACSH